MSARRKILRSIKVRKKRVSVANPYAHIDWEKAAKIFKQPVEEEKKETLYPKVRTLLKVLAAAGVLGLVFAFPGAGPAIGLTLIGGGKFSRWRTKSVLTQMAKQKYVTIKEQDDGTVKVTIRKNGRIKALNYQLETMKQVKPKKWDKRWRLVAFDIPNKYKRVRDIFRLRLEQLGLYRLQESLYVSPYPCFEEVEFLRELYGVAFTVQYIIAQQIEDDGSLRTHFELSD
ncbi:CRISPR-associated endonuclease Cas2 [Candidatus Gottesmanbacteria bacterium]|nr:CRISPR-associated endonuclease Cas2 [Candidatus Gottesmanbacteria bacterium]